LLSQFHFLLYIRLLEELAEGFVFFPRTSFKKRLFVERITSVYNRNYMYSAQLLDHFQNPRNVGDVSGADASVEIENPACGDVMRLSLKMEEGHIVEIRFKAKGCVPAMACGSAVTELVRGRSPAEARSLRREDLIAAVGGLPQASSHAAQLALDVLAAALNQVA
jgi:nitrogen fixation protein NifU and related proteins